MELPFKVISMGNTSDLSLIMQESDSGSPASIIDVENYSSLAVYMVLKIV